MGSVDTFTQQMQQYAPELMANYQTLAGLAAHGDDAYCQTYLGFDNQVIDIALIEKTPALAMVSASFDWMDIGNFKDLHDVVEKDQAGNYVRGEGVYVLDSENAYIRNEEPTKPVAVIGLDNIVVVNTPDGVLVARKDVAAKAGDIAKRIQAGN